MNDKAHIMIIQQQIRECKEVVKHLNCIWDLLHNHKINFDESVVEGQKPVLEYALERNSALFDAYEPEWVHIAPPVFSKRTYDRPPLNQAQNGTLMTYSPLGKFSGEYSEMIANISRKIAWYGERIQFLQDQLWYLTGEE